MRLTSNANFTFLHVRQLDSIFSLFFVIQFLEIKLCKIDFYISVNYSIICTHFAVHICPS